ncbi:DUF169 domain-containing protein [Chloroflexota bacterium]
MDLAGFRQAVDTYVRLDTPPIAIRLVNSADEIPERTRMPMRDFGVKMPLCQGTALARRSGIVVAMGQEDMLCPLGSAGVGFVPAKEGVLDGRFGVPYWTSSQEATANLMKGMARLEYGRHKYVVAAPLERASFEPNVVVMYGNPAQVARMIQAVVYVTGEPVVSRSMGGGACSEQIARTILTGQAQSVLAGGGDRMLAMTQDHETSLALPSSMAEAFTEALTVTHKLGARYPTRSYLIFGATMPSRFGKLMEYLEQDGE